jgi:hypothetical protein
LFKSLKKEHISGLASANTFWKSSGSVARDKYVNNLFLFWTSSSSGFFFSSSSFSILSPSLPLPFPPLPLIISSFGFESSNGFFNFPGILLLFSSPLFPFFHQMNSLSFKNYFKYF